jgi:putative addiction module killer protein
MNVIQQTAVFATWLGGLGDLKARARILARIEGARLGNFGDSEPVGDGVSEMRIDFGPGYRVYYMREGAVLYLLLCGGDKSTQQADIAQARKMANQVKQAAKAKAKAEPEAKTGKAKAKPKAKAKAKAKKG